MKHAIVFVNGKQVSIINTREELIKEINHYQAFWLTNTGQYTNNSGLNRDLPEKGKAYITIEDLTQEDRIWLSSRMK